MDAGVTSILIVTALADPDSPGVAHGYKVISLESAILVYATDQVYNPRDEGRVPYNHASIGAPSYSDEWPTDV
jgi:dTDP-4-dehydrorhamnose 3,5-epimerase-like enzyme